MKRPLILILMFIFGFNAGYIIKTMMYRKQMEELSQSVDSLLVEQEAWIKPRFKHDPDYTPTYRIGIDSLGHIHSMDSTLKRK